MNQSQASAAGAINSRRTGPRHRISAVDFGAAEELLKTAALVIVPDDQKQRQAFEQLMPHLYVLRNKGCSFEQLTKLLTDVGFKLQPSTVRTYYSECLATRLDLCQARMNEQIALMAAIRSETAGTDMTAVSSRVQSIMAAQRNASAHRVDTLLAGSARTAPRALAGPSSEPQEGPGERQEQPRPRRQVADPEPPAEDQGGFGLMSVGRAPAPEAGQPAGFFRLDHEEPAPQAPPSAPAAVAPPASLVPQRPAVAPAAPAASGGPATKNVQKLQDGVPPLKRRDGVPPEVYEPGDLEHPAIPGLVLTLEQRLYGAALEYIDLDGGELFTETPEQKRFRVTWRRQVPVTKTRTGSSFTEMDTTLFNGGSKG